MARHLEAGVTLVELMVIVAIVGILATIAVFTFNKQKLKARASEVPVMFAEFKLKEEQYQLENNAYLSTGTEADFFPTTDPQSYEVAVDLSTAPTWQALRISSDKTALYCGYVAIAGAGGDDSTVGAVAAAAPFNLGSTLPVPSTNWFYVLALCNFDGDETDSQYFTLSGTEGTIAQNAGE